MRDRSLELLRRHRAFRWYWIGQSISVAGSEISEFALPLISVIALGGSARQVSLVAMAGMLPYLLFSLVAGHVLEGREQRGVMIPANLVQAAAMGLIPILWFFDLLTIPLLAVIAFVSGTAALVFGLSAFAFVPRLVDEDDLAAANRAAQASRTVAQVGGPGFAGMLVGAVGAPAAMILDAVSYVASAIGIWKGKSDADTRIDTSASDGEKPSVWTGMRILFTNRWLRALTVHAAAYNFASQIVSINLVLYAVRAQGVGPGTFGLALMASGIGGLIGTLTALRLSDRLGVGRAFAASLVLSCGMPLLLAWGPLSGMRLAGLIAGVMLISGIGLGNANVYSLTLRQSVIPPEHLSRSAGAYSQIMYGTIPLGSAIAGVLGDYAGYRTALLIGAILLACSALPMMTPSVVSLRVTHDARPSS